MMRIENTLLEIGPPTASESSCEVTVRFDLVVEDDAPSEPLVIDVQLRAAGPDESSVVGRGTPDSSAHLLETLTLSAAPPGRFPHEVQRAVHRQVLDVDVDLWRTGTGGEIQPIAEFRDRLCAEVVLRVGDREIARAQSPEIVGSFGPLAT